MTADSDRISMSWSNQLGTDILEDRFWEYKGKYSLKVDVKKILR